ncbi:alpha/beta fold hydrolase [Umezawaea beigongshangensis]|uniref:alpha/beta fold hydrolase n=1 Tax=Umezawaea beigongshangensis TaxID=2780383 RepID=UPI0018F17545|nr:alpha/beta hydrolase [Umezawaea beigongshangensis]
MSGSQYRALITGPGTTTADVPRERHPVGVFTAGWPVRCHGVVAGEESVHVEVVRGPDAVGPPAVFVHGVLSWGTDELYGFGAQRRLGEVREVHLVDRRGHGDSPEVGRGRFRSDYTADARDVVGIVEHLGGAHLVGHSYGAVGVMLAAAARPDLVRSLCLIQPGALRPAEDHPLVAEVLRRNRAATAELPTDLTAERYLRLSVEAVGLPVPDATPSRLRAADAALRERPCWDAEVPLAPLARASWPSLVLVGDWHNAPPDYRRLAGEPLKVAAGVIAREIGAELVTVPGFYPHVQEPELVNGVLAAFWERADRDAATG